MSVMTSSPADLPVLATVVCPYCAVVVPDARFCGACGAHLVVSGSQAANGYTPTLHSLTSRSSESRL